MIDLKKHVESLTSKAERAAKSEDALRYSQAALNAANALNGLVTIAERTSASPIREAAIKHMVERFLMWRLPKHFSPDGGISYAATHNQAPVGTNLFTAAQADEMVRHMVDGLPSA